MLCQGRERVPYASCIWRSWAPLKCKIHVWLTIQHRIWTSDRRARHGLQDHPSACFTCLQEEDNAEHIHLQCSYARQVWHKCIVGLNLEVAHPLGQDSLLDWWLQARRNFMRAARRGFDTFVIAVTWSLWKQRNARVFNRINQQKTVDELHKHIMDEIKEWKEAGLGGRVLDRVVRD